MTYTRADEPTQPIAPKLVSLKLIRLDLLYDVCDDLLVYLQCRRDQNVGLKQLVILSCRVHSEEDISGFEKVVNKVEWSDLEEVGSECKESDSEDSDEESIGCYYDSDSGDY